MVALDLTGVPGSIRTRTKNYYLSASRVTSLALGLPPVLSLNVDIVASLNRMPGDWRITIQKKTDDNF